MGGEIILNSRKGHGSTFGFQIKAPVSIVEKVEETEEELVQSVYAGRVLIAEDNEMSAILMETLMEAFEIEIDMVINGEEAVESVKNNDYALVLMDNQMPKLSGIDATKQIRKFNTTVPIVALSANALNSEQDLFLEVGMNDTLSKPVDYQKLKKVLDVYLT